MNNGVQCRANFFNLRYVGEEDHDGGGIGGASIVELEIWHPNIPGARELVFTLAMVSCIRRLISTILPLFFLNLLCCMHWKVARCNVYNYYVVINPTLSGIYAFGIYKLVLYHMLSVQ